MLNYNMYINELRNKLSTLPNQASLMLFDNNDSAPSSLIDRLTQNPPPAGLLAILHIAKMVTSEDQLNDNIKTILVDFLKEHLKSAATEANYFDRINTVEEFDDFMNIDNFSDLKDTFEEATQLEAREDGEHPRYMTLKEAMGNLFVSLAPLDLALII